jgi:glycine/D-amino acid oxidase-like deaminating enzyme
MPGASFGDYSTTCGIWEAPDKERIFYLLGYGGTGKVYSMLGSSILRDLILDRPNKDADIVKLDR